jgi:thiamine-monophosphate kinase
MVPRRRTTRLKDLREEGLLDYFRRRLPPSSPRVAIGPGDDAAVVTIPPGKKLLATTDLMVEGIHFTRSGTSPSDLGYKIVAVNVSDLAATGGRPLFALLSLALPPSLEFDFTARLLRGLIRASRKFGMEVVGGDTTSSAGGIFVGLAVLGVPSGHPLTRAGAAAGDRLYVSGHLGASALGLDALRRGRRRSGHPAFKRVIRKHLRPSPPLFLGTALAAKSLATSCVDISDGLSTDLAHLCRESRVGAEVFAADLPIRPSTRKAAEYLRCDVLEAALHGGEEYELLFTVRPSRTGAVEKLARVGGVRITPIGNIVDRRRGSSVISAGGEKTALSPGGWDHFSPPRRKRDFGKGVLR